MNELINSIASKVGITPEQAQQAAGMVVGFLKDKLPAPVASQIESVIGGGGTAGGDGISNIASGIGGMFGGDTK